MKQKGIRRGKPAETLTMQESGVKKKGNDFFPCKHLKEDDEDICTLIFLGRSSVCLEAKHNLSLLTLNWFRTSLAPVLLLITLSLGMLPTFPDRYVIS